jgi:hypothetical protein
VSTEVCFGQEFFGYAMILRFGNCETHATWAQWTR